MTWDGVVTKFHKQYRADIGIDNRLQAYVQSRVLKMTLESLTMESRRRGSTDSECVLEAQRSAVDETKLSRCWETPV